MDRHTAALVLGWIRKIWKAVKIPVSTAKALSANLSGQWRYRVGDYRILAEIQEDRVMILVLAVGHRREIYQ